MNMQSGTWDARYNNQEGTRYPSFFEVSKERNNLDGFPKTFKGAYSVL